MTRWLQNLPLRCKLTLVIMLTTCLALFIACLAVVIYEQLTFFRSLTRDLSITAEMTGLNSSAGLVFGDPGSVESALKSLRAQPHITRACVYNREGKIFAEYRRDPREADHFPARAPQEQQHFDYNRLELFRPVLLEGERIGGIYLESDLEELTTRFWRYALILSLVMVAVPWLALLISRKLQRIVSEPIFHLVQTASRVAEEKDFSIRAHKHGEDELGQLIDGFNEMLRQIQERDAALRSGRDDLEIRVAERTQELEREVAERKQSEEALRLSEDRFRSLFDSCRDAVMTLEPPSWKFTSGNPATVAMFGARNEEQFVTLGPWDLSPEVQPDGRASAEAAREMIETAMREGSRLFEWTHRRMNGEAFPTIVLLSRMELAGKAFLQATVRDITERKRAEESLRLLSSAIEQSADNVVITDSDGIIQYVNPAMLKLTGHSREDVIGQNPRILKSGQHKPEFFQELWQTIRAGKTFRAEFTNRKKNGEIFSEEKTIGPVLDSSGAITHFVATGRDVTERKRSEAEVEALNKQLLETSRQAGMAEVATGVLHNVGNTLNSVNVTATLLADGLKKSTLSDLVRLMDLLREHTADLGGFLTHDPKGQKVLGFLNRLTERLNQEQASHLQEVDLLRHNIEHIKDIVAMQQSYAQVSGVVESLNVTDLVEDTLRMNAGALQRHEVEVVREYAPVPRIPTERHKVLQILTNLVRNAKYACDESGRPDRRLILRVARTGGASASAAGAPPADPDVPPAIPSAQDTPSGRRDACPTSPGEAEHIQISVIDNGVGIRAENLTRIFNHGFTTRKDGHGFGLHSGALAAKELGGQLTVTSDGPGQGAVFTLKLPIQPLRKAA